jgi:hypothetical protein
MGRMATEQRIRMFQIGEEGHVEHDEGKTDDKRQGKIGSSGGASSQSLSKLGDEGHEQGDENGEDRWNGKLSEKSGPPQRQGNGILEFPNELLLLILRHVDTDPGPISIESRPWMSVVSFKYETMIPRDPNAVGNFRRSCRKFSEVGLEHQYKRLATEFSAKGLERLRNIAGKPHLANAVQKFTYLVPTLFFNGTLLVFLQGQLLDPGNVDHETVLTLCRCFTSVLNLCSYRRERPYSARGTR